MKKNNSKLKYVLIVIFLLIFITAFFYVKKFIIFNSISNKLSSYDNKSNYHIRMYEYLGNSVNTTEIWVKDKNLVKTFNNLPDTMLKNDIIYTFIDGTFNKETSNKNIDSIQDWPWSFIYNLTDDLKNPINIFTYSLNESNINGKECYKIEYFDEFKTVCHFDKKNGLIVRYETLVGRKDRLSEIDVEIQSTLIDFKFEFDTVTDKDILMFENKN